MPKSPPPAAKDPRKGPNQCATPGCCAKNLLPLDTRCASCHQAAREQREQAAAGRPNP